MLGLNKTEFIGYTVDVTRAPDETFPVINHNLTADDEKKAKVRKDQIGVYDLDDNQVNDFRRLDYGQGTLTKNGYATFDLSQLEPGTYITSQWDAAFEIC